MLHVCADALPHQIQLVVVVAQIGLQNGIVEGEEVIGQGEAVAVGDQEGAAPGVTVLGALWVLRNKLGGSIKAEPYWKEDKWTMIRYTIPVAVLTIVGVVSTSVDSLIIRHRLSDFESGGYYVITRFTEITSYLGTVFLVFLFPMVASRTAKNQSARDILFKTLWGSMGSGLVFAFFLAFAGPFILGLQNVWSAYRPLAGHMFWVCILNILLMGNTAFATYESARGCFRFLWYVLPITMVKCVGLYLLTGYGFFDGLLPREWLDTIATLNPNRLGFVIGVLIVTQVLIFVYFIVDVIKPKRPLTATQEECL